MAPYITLNGISSIDKGLRLVAAEPFIIPTRTRHRETVPGRLGSISTGAFETPALGYRLRLAATADDKAAVVRALNAIAGWLLSGRVLTVWHDPTLYYTGAVEGAASFSMLTRKTGQIEVDFVCDPPCWHRPKVNTPSWRPAADKPIPEQINASINTASASGTTAFDLAVSEVTEAQPPALYLRITGTWTALTFGTLRITEAATASTDLYIDCEAQEIYHLDAGVRVNAKYSGDFPVLTDGGIHINGTDFNVTARLLVIERG